MMLVFIILLATDQQSGKPATAVNNNLFNFIDNRYFTVGLMILIASFNVG